MKKLFFAFIAVVALVCGCNKTERFKVELNLDNADHQTVYFGKDVDGVYVRIDTAVIVDKKAVFHADAGDPQTAYLIKFSETEPCGAFSFFTENHDMTITGDGNEIQYWVAKGCPAQDELNAFHQSMLPYEEEMMALFSEEQMAYMAGDTVRSAELSDQVMTKMDEYHGSFLRYIKNHPDSFVAHFLFDQIKDDPSYHIRDLQETFDYLTTETVYSKRVKAYLKEQSKIKWNKVE
ncbi:MAG: DUF4369 domain-containing protein [Bacteroidales bacterium]|nr:DUF4369 domain-containing protein [Bacteroidales bacterium]